MSDVKQVKVDNWGIYFLQRLKHFFNRTDYCDLTLQFQDNAQLKVHRLVLNACTEYFELLERTCEMYEDCLVMPDDLQADVVVPIVNFMYTGHLEFKLDLLERLYQTSQILNMPVLSKLLESHRNVPQKAPTHSYSGVKRFTRQNEPKSRMTTATPSTSTNNKRSYSKAFENNVVYRDRKTLPVMTRPVEIITTNNHQAVSPVPIDPLASSKVHLNDPRPTRYEIPEELDNDNVFDNSFSSISYTSQPLMVHPDTVKRYKAKRSGLFGESLGAKKLSGMSTVDIVECKRITTKNDSLFDDSTPEHNLNDETGLFNASLIENEKDSNQLFDQILDPNDGPKVTIETKDSKTASNLDHARIISEVLKKYPHLVKSNKNIKLKILDPVPTKGKKMQKHPTIPMYVEDKSIKLLKEEEDFTYETDVLDSKQAARLIAMGAENVKGPWICLICGTPGKALHFNTYFKFRRHLVDVHNEKPVSNICEYCGLRSLKRNVLLHHLFAQHGVNPPPQYHFPKCNLCSYIALTEGLLVKHKLTHKDYKNFRCNVCYAAFASSSQLLIHIQNTGHKYCSEKRNNLQCIYCLKVFLRETNLYAHIKTHHKTEAKSDCVIEDSDEEEVEERPRDKSAVKFEPSTSFGIEYEEADSPISNIQKYPVQQRSTNQTQVAARKHNAKSKQKILNPGFGKQRPVQKPKTTKTINHNQTMHSEIFKDSEQEESSKNQEEEIVVIDNNEYIMRDNKLIPRKRNSSNREYIIADMVEPSSLQTIQQPTTSMEYTNVQNTNSEGNVQQQSSMMIKKSANINQPIQIVVSNEEEYKALMASNHPIIFDSGDTNKTLTVLTAPHHNPAIETAAIDLDNTQSNEMMILPHEYPLNVTEAVTTENSNIVVVYSHPVDDQNKQFQILTTGGIGAQFVESSAIITQNYETVTTSTSAMNTHCIESQDQPWQENIPSLESHIQLPSHTEMQNVVDSNQVQMKQVHRETDNNLDELPEVHLGTEPQKMLSPDVSDTNVHINQLNVGHLDQTIQHEISEESVNEPVEAFPQSESMPDILANNESIVEPMEEENVLVQSMETANVIEQQIETEQSMEPENELEQPIESENLQEQLVETENILEQPMETENALEQPVEAENILEEPIETENILQQPTESENVLEQPIDTGSVMEQPLETEDIIQQQLVTENIMEEPRVTENIEQPTLAVSVMETVETENMIDEPVETENIEEELAEKENEMGQQSETETLIESTQQSKLISEPEIPRHTQMEQNSNDILDDEAVQSQTYDDIVVIHHVNNETGSICSKKDEDKIQHLTSEWSEDEYDVAEENDKGIKKVSTQNSQNQISMAGSPEIEESIENIQQEMRKQMSAVAEPDAETEESAVSSPEEDSSSQEKQLNALNEPVHTDVQNPQVQQKISSLLNDWEDNDSQEEMVADNENVTVPTPEKTDSLPVNAEEPKPQKHDNIKSLVSDWDDDDEEHKE